MYKLNILNKNNRFIFRTLKPFSKVVNNKPQIYSNLRNFKSLISKLLDEKIYHYSLFNNDTKELYSLKQLSNDHLAELNNIEDNKNTDLCLSEKVWLFNNATILLEYRAFVELIKYVHEKKEEEINNYLRDVYVQHGNKDNQMLLIKIRDEWRNCLLPDILDSQAKPVNPLSMVSQVNMELNKYLSDIII
jgi:hypothetical protein